MKKILFAFVVMAIAFHISAQKAPHMEFNDCKDDVVSVTFNKNTSTLYVDVQTSHETTTLDSLRTLNLSWYYNLEVQPDNDSVILGWMWNHHFHENNTGDAWASIGWYESPRLVTGAGITVPVKAIKKIPAKQGELRYAIRLNKEQVAHLNRAKALDQTIDTPRLWFKG